jgi:hypothetical protein
MARRLREIGRLPIKPHADDLLLKNAGHQKCFRFRIEVDVFCKNRWIGQSKRPLCAIPPSCSEQIGSKSLCTPTGHEAMRALCLWRPANDRRPVPFPRICSARPKRTRHHPPPHRLVPQPQPHLAHHSTTFASQAQPPKTLAYPRLMGHMRLLLQIVESFKRRPLRLRSQEQQQYGAQTLTHPHHPFV